MRIQPSQVGEEGAWVAMLGQSDRRRRHRCSLSMPEFLCQSGFPFLAESQTPTFKGEYLRMIQKIDKAQKQARRVVVRIKLQVLARLILISSWGLFPQARRLRPPFASISPQLQPRKARCVFKWSTWQTLTNDNCWHAT